MALYPFVDVPIGRAWKRSQDRCVVPIACGAREFVTSSTGGHFDSAGPDKKRDAMSCELDNATNNDLCARPCTRSTSTRESVTHRFTHWYIFISEVRHGGQATRNVEISNPFPCSCDRTYLYYGRKSSREE